MEKKQKIAMKKLQFVIFIILDSNCLDLTIRGQYNSLRWKFSGGIVQGTIVLGVGIARGAIVLGGNCLRW